MSIRFLLDKLKKYRNTSIGSFAELFNVPKSTIRWYYNILSYFGFIYDGTYTYLMCIRHISMHILWIKLLYSTTFQICTIFYSFLRDTVLLGQMDPARYESAKLICNLIIHRLYALLHPLHMFSNWPLFFNTIMCLILSLHTFIEPFWTISIGNLLKIIILKKKKFLLVPSMPSNFIYFFSRKAFMGKKQVLRRSLHCRVSFTDSRMSLCECREHFF